MKKMINKITYSIISISLLSGCTKEKNNKNDISWTVIKNSSLANAIDTIQAIAKDYTNNISYYYYGDYDSFGEPSLPKRAVIKRVDTLINITLDDSMRVSKYYCTIQGLRDTTLLQFSYVGNDVILNIFYYDRITDNARLKNQTIFKNLGGSYSIFSSINYRITGFDQWISAMGTVIATTVTVFTVVTVGTGLAVAGLTGLPALGIAAGIAAGIYLLTPPANGSEVSFQSSTSEPIPPKPSKKYEYTIKVDSKSAWLNTGILVKQGTQYLIQQLAGGWSVDINNYPLVSADGHINEASTPLANLQGAKTLSTAFFGCLLGKVNNTIFRIGANFNGTFPANGVLEFQINDNARADNGGNITMKIKEQ